MPASVRDVFDRYLEQGQCSLHRLREIGEEESKIVFYPLDTSRSLEQIPNNNAFLAKGTTKEWMLLFKRDKSLKVGMAKFQDDVGFHVHPVSTLKLGLDEVQSEKVVKKDAIILFPLADLYGNLKLKVTPGNKKLFTPTKIMNEDGTSSFKERQFVECKMTNASVHLNELRLDLQVLNQDDVVPGTSNWQLSLLLES